MAKPTKEHLRKCVKELAELLNKKGIECSVGTGPDNDIVVGIPRGTKHSIPKSFKKCPVVIKTYQK